MPYKSRAQAAFMHINHPEIAKDWDKKYYHKALKKKATKKVDDLQSKEDK